MTRKIDPAEANHPLTGIRRTGIVEHTTNAPATVNVWIGNDSTDPDIPSVPVPYLGFPPVAGDEVLLLSVGGDPIVLGVKPGDVVPGDTGWITTGLTAATNWSTIGGSKWSRVGSLVHLKVGGVARSNSTLVSTGTGNLTNTTVLNLPAAITPAVDLFVGHWTSDGQAGSAVVRAAGTFQIIDMYPSQTLAIGDTINGYYTYRVDVT